VPTPLTLDDFPAETTADEFWQLIGKVENEHLEFKRGLPDSIKNTIPAMAMTDGGLIVLGIEDGSLEIVGTELSQKTLDRITRYANECDVDVQVRSILIDDVEVTITAVPEVRGRIATTPDGRLLRRVGGDCQPLRGDALARFVRERSERSAEEEPLQRFDPAEFDLQLVNQALRADGKSEVRRDKLLRALTDLGIARAGLPPTGHSVLRAAAVLFSRDAKQHVAGATIQLVRRDGVGPGPGPAKAREECVGPLSHLLDCALNFIGQHTQRYQVVLGSRREILPEYPEAVLREALLNAVAHRDYGLTGSTVDVTIWDDRIEVHSPGPLPGHITVDNMRTEHYSRNRHIMGVLRLLDLVEEYGEGVDRMIEEMEARLMEPPIFSATPSSVTVTLRNRFLVDIDAQVWLSLLGRYQLSAFERRALVLARQGGSVTRRELKRLIPEAAVDGALSGAVAKGLLVRVGERGGSRYELSDEVVLRAGSQGMEAQVRRRQLLLDEIHRQGSISTAEGAQLLGEDMAAVRHLLNDLASAGLVRAEGRTRGRRYFSS